MAAKKRATKKATSAAAGDDFELVFSALRAMLVPHAKSMAVVRDKPGDYYVDTHETAPNGKPLFFAAVAKRKGYVSFYYFPVYTTPALLDDVSKELRARMQGKSCFNFKVMDEALFGELERLVTKGVRAWQREGRI
jgi:hypothetical protein